MRNRATTPLKKAKVRQSWSKYNLYNLSRITSPPYKTRTFFQQKWTAKSLLRNYHGEQVREGQWERMFSRRLRAVVPMDPGYLASNDGSLEAAGRGSGLAQGRSSKPAQIPYMQMTFAPLERRLDTAIFRAMFASSARQARQFVVHGAVEVNGQKMKHPGYLLNPGDMFQVDVGRVMFATGARKESTKAKSAELDAEDGDSKAVAKGPDGAEKASEDNGDVEKYEEAEIEEDPRHILKGLLEQSKSILSSPRQKDMGAKRKQDLRAFQKSVKRTLSRSKSATILTDSLEAQFLELQYQLGISPDASHLPLDHKEVSNISSEAAVPKSISPTSFEDQEMIPNSPEQHRSTSDSSSPSSLDLTNLKMALELLRENPTDPSKPYATPWQPREYMSAFAFIPRYLEVNHNICAAVYLRHPVARPGLAEVPTPFSEGTSREGFGWYLRRR